MGTNVRIGRIWGLPSSPLGSEKMTFEPTGRGEVGPGNARLWVQGPLLARAPIMAPRIEASKSEPGLHPELWVVPSDSGAELQPFIHSLNDKQCPRGCRPERRK